MVIRRQLPEEVVLVLDDQHERQQGLGFLKDPEDIRAPNHRPLDRKTTVPLITL